MVNVARFKQLTEFSREGLAAKFDPFYEALSKVTDKGAEAYAETQDEEDDA
jgi:hypothetical protein